MFFKSRGRAGDPGVYNWSNGSGGRSHCRSLDGGEDGEPGSGWSDGARGAKEGRERRLLDGIERDCIRTWTHEA